ncbi:MAG: TolC family protein [Capsulimonadaceae bacterium]
MGRPLDAALTLDDGVDIPDTPIYTEADACAKAVDASPDVRAAQQSATAQAAAARSARLWQEPSLSIEAVDARSGDVTSLTREDSLQASVTVPLDDGGLVRGQELEAAAMLAQARANLESARAAAEAAAGAAYRNAACARLLAQSTRDALDIAVEANDKTVRGYQDGLFSLTDVLNAGQALAQARAAYTQARYDAQASAALLRVAIGEPPQGRG